MRKIEVNTAHPYNVFVGKGLLSELGLKTKNVTSANKIAIISDSNVWPLYKETVLSSFQAAGYSDIISYIFPAGEQSKNGSTYLDVLEFLAQNQITRTDCLVALGGGVVGDLTGFAAATFLRGIDYIQVPTSLLACVDSSVGGKTAIDLKAGKNLAGAFYQPKLVVCDTDTLSTLPDSVFVDGCAEVIKYGILYDPELFAHLESRLLDFDREWVVACCIQRKRDVVINDEFDRGERQKLNLGHTLGHSIEKASQFSITHGQGVSIGIALICAIAASKIICAPDTYCRIIRLLDSFGLPTCTKLSSDILFSGALSDKKRSADQVNLIIPTQIGECIIKPTPVDQLLSDIEAGLSYEYTNPAK